MAKLTEVLKIQSNKSNYAAMHSYIIKCLKSYPGVSFTEDKFGNIYATKVSKDAIEFMYPAFACRTDSYQAITDSKIQIKRQGRRSHTWMAFKPQDETQPRQVGIGGDAKCGIYLCLKLLQSCPFVKCVFFVKAEDQFAGAANCNIEFFKDCKWILEFDRKGNRDIIVEAGGKEMCSKDFREDISKIGRRYGLGTTNGANCDIFKVKLDKGLDISVANISCGYYRPRSNFDQVIERDLAKTLQFAKDAVEQLTRVYTHAYVSTVKTIIPVAQSPSVALIPRRDRECSVCETTLLADDVVLCRGCLARGNLMPVICKKCGLRLFKQVEIANKACAKHITLAQIGDISEIPFH